MNEFTHSHDRHVDRVPAQSGHAALSTVLGCDVAGRVQVGVKSESTFPAFERCPGTTVVLRYVTTARASLRGMSRVNPDHRTAPFLSLVLDETFDLSEGPTVEPSFSFGLLFGPHTLTDIGQVFQHDCATSGNGLDDLLGEDVIAVAPEPCLGLADLFEVPLGRFCSPGLKSAPQLEQPVFDGPPRLLSEEKVIGRDSRLSESEVYAYNGINGSNLWGRNGDGNVHGPTTIAVNQVGGVHGVPRVSFRIFGDCKAERLAACDGGQPHSTGSPVDLEGVHVVARRAGVGVRARDLFPFAFEGKRASDCFGCFDAGLNVEVAHERRVLDFERAIELVVEADPVLFGVFPPASADGVEDLGEQVACLRESRDLLGSGFKRYDDCPSHKATIPYAFAKVNKERRAAIPLPAKADSPLAA